VPRRVHTVAERFLRAQLVFNPAQLGGQERPDAGGQDRPGGAGGPGGGGKPSPRGGPRRPAKRYNALGILEDVAEDEVGAGSGGGVAVAANGSDGDGAEDRPRQGEREVLDIGPDEPPKQKVVAKADPVVVGAGRARPLSAAAGASGAGTPAASADWSSVGRNDPCPCGSGKKFKKCHGAAK